MLPPPVNWHTKPMPHQQQHRQENSSLATSQHSDMATNVLIPVYINPAHLHDIEAALCFLGLPLLANHGNNHDQAALHQDTTNHATPPQFEQLDNFSVSRSEYHLNASPIGHHSPEQSLDISDISSSFSRLSTLTTSIQVPLGPFPGRRAPDVQPNLSSQPSTSTTSVQVSSGSFPVRHAPDIQHNPSPRKGMKKYYVITVGKCTGVFWDEW